MLERCDRVLAYTAELPRTEFEVHGYLGIDDDILWDLIQRRIPELKRQLFEIRARVLPESDR